MPRRTRQSPPDPKLDALRADGAWNRRAAQVRDPLFGAHAFFDARDVVQVKYEMLRRVEIEAQPIAPTAAAFRFSRPSFYQAQQAFHQRGLAGLLPQKRGPHGGHKLTAEIIAFLQEARVQEASLRPADLVQRVAHRFGITVHPRSIGRALERQEKKRQR
jgi:transposase